MGKLQLLICVVCLVIGILIGRRFVEEKKVINYVQQETIRDTITRFIPDTVYLTGKLKYKYVYKIDTVYRDVPVVDREGTILETIKDWNQVRKYERVLFDNESGKMSVDLHVQYNELQNLSYAFTPLGKEITVQKKRVFVPFVSVSCCRMNSFSMGGGFFYYDVGIRVEWMAGGMNCGVMYMF